MKILLGNLGANKNDYKNLKVEDGKVYVEKNDKTNLIASFPTRSGFMTKIAIPTIISENNKNLVVIDLKSEIYHKTKEEKKEQGYHLYKLDLDNVTDDNKGLYYSDIIETINKDKFIIYINIEDMKMFNLCASKRIMDFILDKVRESGKDCLTIFEECGAFLDKNKNIYPYILDNGNNQFLLKFQSVTMAMRLGISELDVLEIEFEDRNEKRYFNYKYMKNLGKKIEKVDIVEDDYSKRFEYIGKEEMEIEIFKTNIEIIKGVKSELCFYGSETK